MKEKKEEKEEERIKHLNKLITILY